MGQNLIESIKSKHEEEKTATIQKSIRNPFKSKSAPLESYSELKNDGYKFMTDKKAVSAEGSP